MAISNINKSLIKTNSKSFDGYETLKNAIKTDKIKKITKRDAIYLLNKQMEGVSETNGNLFIYMFYWCGSKRSDVWYTIVVPNDGGSESTPWCACYISFILNFSGISNGGGMLARTINNVMGLTINTTDFNQAKSMDVIVYNGHTSFLCLEDEDKKNNYKKGYYQLGGNQGDTVKLSPPSNKSLLALSHNNSYDTEISSGFFLSVLGYFKNLNTKNGDERLKLIQSRLKKDSDQNDTISKEIGDIRQLIGESDGCYLGDNEIFFTKKFNELLNFEKSLIKSNLPLTKNIGQQQASNRSSSDR